MPEIIKLVDGTYNCNCPLLNNLERKLKKQHQAEIENKRKVLIMFIRGLVLNKKTSKLIMERINRVLGGK